MARYVGARLGDPGWVEAWQPPAADAPLVLVALSSGAQDQLGVLRRVVEASRARRGAGLRLEPSAKPSAIAAAVQRLLDEPRHREGARRLADALRAERGRDEAADELEGAHEAAIAA